MKSVQFRRQFFAAAAAVLLSAAPLFATTYIWAGGGGAANPNWSNPNNWISGVPPVSSASTDIIFGNAGAAYFPVQDTGSPFSLRSLSFDMSGYSLAINSLYFPTPGFLHFNASSSQITTPHPTTSIEITSDLTIDGNGNAAINALIRGGGNTRIIKTGTGSVSLTQQRQFGGELQINGGQMVMTDSLGVQGSTVVINVDNGFNLNGLAVTAIGGLSGNGALNLGNALFIIRPTGRPEAAPYTGTMSGSAIINIANDIAATFGGAGSTAHRLEVNGHLKLDGALGFGGASLTATSSSPIDQFDDNILIVGNPRASDGTVGTLIVRDGFVLNTIGNSGQGKTWVGGSLNSPSTITITGYGSRWRAGSTNYIGGYKGAGRLTVAAAGAITDARDMFIGAGNKGTGTLVVQTGGTVHSATGLLGVIGGSDGSAIVTDPESLWTVTSELTLGTPVNGGGRGTLLISNGGAVVSEVTTQLQTANSSITINGGTFRTGFLMGNAGVINLADPAGGAALTIDGLSAGVTYSGAIRGTGSIVKNGTSIQTLSGENAWQGRTTVNGGTLLLPSASSLAFTANSGGRLRLQFGDFGFRSLTANQGGTINYETPIIVGGFVHGRGDHDFSQVSSFNGTTFGPAVSLTLSTPALNNVTNSGALNLNGVTWTGGYNTAAGAITVGGTVDVSHFENSGAITVSRRSTLVNSETNLVSGAGGRVTIDSQGAIELKSTSLDLFGSLLINNGSINGTTNVGFGALAKGSGVYGEVNVTDGGRFSPGNSPGSVTTGAVTWNSGGRYSVELADALAGAGVGWDLWNIDGELLINALTHSTGRFSITLNTLAGDGAGPAANFEPNHDYRWLILESHSDLHPYLDRLFLDHSSFANPHRGTLGLSTDGGSLYIHYSAVPEPTVAGLFACLVAVGFRRTSCRFSAGLR